MANGTSTSTIEELSHGNQTPQTPSLSPTRISNPIPAPKGDGPVSGDIFRAILPDKNYQAITPKSESTATKPGEVKTDFSPPILGKLTPAVLTSSSLGKLNPAVLTSSSLGKLTPAVPTSSSLDKVASPEVPREIGLIPGTRQAKKTGLVDVTPIKADDSPTLKAVQELGKIGKKKDNSGDVIERIEGKGDLIIPKTERVEKQEEAKKILVTKSQQAAKKAFEFSDPTLQAIAGTVPGSPSLPSSVPGQVNQGESTETQVAQKRRRYKIRMGQGSASSISIPSIPTFSPGSTSLGGESSSSSSQTVQPGTPIYQVPQSLPRTQVGEQEDTIQNEQVEETPQTDKSGQEQQRKDKIEQRNLEKEDIEDAKKQYDRFKGEQPKPAEAPAQPATQGAGAATEAAPGAAQGAAGAAQGTAGATQAASGAATGTAAGGTAATGGAAAAGGVTISVGLIAVIILAIIVVILIALLIFVMASIASTLNTIQNANTTGNSAAFFSKFNPRGGSDVFTTETVLFDRSEETGPFLFDAAGNVKEIRLSYIIELKAIEEYNKAFLGSNSSSEVIVTNMNLNSALNIPPEYRDAAGNVYKTGPYEGYSLDLKIPNFQAAYPSNLAVGNNNVFTWSPVICNELKGQSGLLNAGYYNEACKSQYPERFATILKFGQPIPSLAFNDRLEVTLSGTLTVDYYEKSSDRKLGTGQVPINSTSICIDVSSITRVNCLDPNNAVNITPGATGGAVGPTINPGGGTGDVVAGCPIAINQGERLVCTSGYDPFRVLTVNGVRTSSPHYANDVVVQNASGQSQRDRSIISPVTGKIIKIATDSFYISNAGIWVQIQDSDNPNVVVMLAHIQPGFRRFNIGDSINKGDVLGRQFSGIPNAFWTGSHLHFETIYAPNQKGSDPKEYLQKGCNQPNYSCN